MRPRIACDVSHRSRNHWTARVHPLQNLRMNDDRRTKNSKNAIIPTTPRKCAIKAITEPNKGYMGSNMGPRHREVRKSTKSAAEFQTIGPREMIAIRTKGLGGCLPFGSGNDLTNM